MHENETRPERGVLVSVNTGAYDTESSLDELQELAFTAGAEILGRFIQNREKPDKATYVGEGKLQEIQEYCEENDADLLIFDDELSGSQIRNIEEVVKIRVVDRTALILDIFAARARSREGQLQVELAQQKYRLPRLIGLGKQLSRLGGGIGTRGPGETKLESDRRHIHRRIDALEADLATLSEQRSRVRERRAKNSAIVIAIVGYTNVGKSTLLNLLTEADVFVENQLFATLDPTARELVLPNGQHTILVDTVGLIQRLPHQLVEAFHSTLEEAAEADLILNVCDYANPAVDQQLAVTKELLNQLGCDEMPVITVYNKTDLRPDEPIPPSSERTVFLSAKSQQNIDFLLTAIETVLADMMCQVTLLIPYSEGGLLHRVREQGKVIHEEFEERGVRMDANIDRKFRKDLEPYCIK